MVYGMRIPGTGRREAAGIPAPGEVWADSALLARVGADVGELGRAVLHAVGEPVGLGARVVLGHAATEEQAGGAVVPPARGDGAAADGLPASYQVRPASRGSQRSARSVTLTSWPSASSAASFTCWMREPA